MSNVVQIQKINWWHERLADWMLANPERSIKEAAPIFNVTVSYLYMLKNTDTFKAYWISRSTGYSSKVEDEAKDDILGLTAKTAGVAEQALDALSSRLASTGDVLPVNTLIDVANMGLKSLGYTANSKTPPAQVNVNVGLVDASALAQARERMRQVYSVDTAAEVGPPVKQLENV
jgi:hypothetical protein